MNHKAVYLIHKMQFTLLLIKSSQTAPSRKKLKNSEWIKLFVEFICPKCRCRIRSAAPNFYVFLASVVSRGRCEIINKLAILTNNAHKARDFYAPGRACNTPHEIEE
jgi:hypothetical protein